MIVYRVGCAIRPGQLAAEFTGSKSNRDPALRVALDRDAGDATHCRHDWSRQFAVAVRESIDTRDLSRFATAM